MTPSRRLLRRTASIDWRVVAVLSASTLVVGLSPVARAQGASSPSATDLIRAIRDSEGRIRDVQVHMTCTVPAQCAVFYECDWGYDHGKEFIAGTFYARNGDDPNGEPRSTEVKIAFDGEAERVYRVQRVIRNGQETNAHSGRVCALASDDLKGHETPVTLLGHDVRYDGRQTLGEALAQTSAVSVRAALDPIDGHACYVLEALEVDRTSDGRVFDALEAIP